MHTKHGEATGRFGVWLAQLLGSMPKYRDYLVLYDHADKETGAHPCKVHGFYGDLPTNANRLAEVDVMVATPSQEVVLVIEIEESQSSPKKLLGDILAVLMCNHFAAKVAAAKATDEQMVFSVTDQTQPIIASVAAEQGSGQKKINEVIVPRLQQMVSSPDGIRTGNVTLLLRPDVGITIRSLERMVQQLFQCSHSPRTASIPARYHSNQNAPRSTLRTADIPARTLSNQEWLRSGLRTASLFWCLQQ